MIIKSVSDIINYCTHYKLSDVDSRKILLNSYALVAILNKQNELVNQNLTSETYSYTQSQVNNQIVNMTLHPQTNNDNVKNFLLKPIIRDVKV